MIRKSLVLFLLVVTLSAFGVDNVLSLHSVSCNGNYPNQSLLANWQNVPFQPTCSKNDTWTGENGGTNGCSGTTALESIVQVHNMCYRHHIYKANDSAVVTGACGAFKYTNFYLWSFWWD